MKLLKLHKRKCALDVEFVLRLFLCYISSVAASGRFTAVEESKMPYLSVIRGRFTGDSGFMGVTHALSVLAASLMLLAFAPAFMTGLLKTNDTAALILFVIVSIGAGNLPDLDNTHSRAKSDLGMFGVPVSAFFRTTSVIAQSAIRTKRDDPTPNPHRGAWHTIPAAMLLGGLTFFGTRIESKITLPVLGETTWGYIVALVIAFILTHLMLSTLAKKMMDKVRKSNAVGEMIALAISSFVTFSLMRMISNGSGDFWWLGIAVAFGMSIHVLGDCFTTAGAPIFFPITGLVRGKFWWTTRFLPIKAGGPFENYVFVPVFVILSVVGIAKILHSVIF